MQYIKDLYWKYDVLLDNLIADRDQGLQWLAIDSLGMLISPPDVFGRTMQLFGMTAENIGEFSIPAGSNGDHAALTGGSSYMFSASATREEIDAAFKWLAVTGYSPECTDEIMQTLEAEVQAKLAGNDAISNVNMSP